MNISISNLKKQKKSCLHNDYYTEYMPTDYIHYAKIICTDCDKFIKWAENPEVTKKYIERQNVICHIEQTFTNRLTDWEKSFLTDIFFLRFLTPKRLEYYNKIIKKYNSTKTPHT